MQNPKTQSIETCNKCSPPGNQKAKTHNFLPVYFGGNLRVLPYLMSFFLSGVSVAPVVGYLEKIPWCTFAWSEIFFVSAFPPFFFRHGWTKASLKQRQCFLFFKEKRLRAEQAYFAWSTSWKKNVYRKLARRLRRRLRPCAPWNHGGKMKSLLGWQFFRDILVSGSVNITPGPQVWTILSGAL